MPGTKRRIRGTYDYGVKKPQKRKNVPSHYRDQYVRLHKHRVVEVLMNPNENTKQHSKEYKSVVEEWPVGRIKALSEAPGMGLKGLANYLGITPRTLRLLISGEYTPSATFCRRLAMIEREVLEGKDSYKDILPRRAEMRRRLLLFRSWWMNRPATLALPEVTVSIKVRWGKGVINAFEIPTNLIPKLRLKNFGGLADVVREVTKTLRVVSRSNAKLLWSEMESDWWAAYASNDVPAIVEQRLKQPAMARAARTEKEKNGRQVPASQL